MAGRQYAYETMSMMSNEPTRRKCGGEERINDQLNVSLMSCPAMAGMRNSRALEFNNFIWLYALRGVMVMLRRHI